MADRATDAKASNRSVVSLPNDTMAEIDKIGASIQRQIADATGASIDLSRAQVITLLAQRERRQETAETVVQAAAAPIRRGRPPSRRAA